MGPQTRLFDDFARIAGGAAGALTGVKAEVEALFRQQFERILADMELVNHEEFDVVRAMVSAARVAQESLADRLTALEAQFTTATPTPTTSVSPHRIVARQRSRRSASAALSRTRKRNLDSQKSEENKMREA